MYETKITPQLIENQPDEIYHGQKEYLSSSMVRLFLREGEYSFYDAVVGDVNVEPTDAMRFGTIVHCAILEPERFKNKYKVVPEFLGLTKEGNMSALSKAAKEKKAAWMSDQPPDTIFVTEEELERLTGVVEAFSEHETARKIIEEGMREVSGFYNDKETGLAMKIRPDFLHRQYIVLSDLKTCQDPTAKGFSNAIANGMYHVQIAMYCDGVEQITGVRPQIPNFIAIQNKRPYNVFVWVADDTMIDEGRKLYRQGITGIAKCLEKKIFNRPQKIAEMISLPYWAVKDSIYE